MLMRMVTGFASSLSRSRNVLAAPPVYLCRMQPAPRIRYPPDHLSQALPSAACFESCINLHPVLTYAYLQALQDAFQVFHGPECAPGLS